MTLVAATILWALCASASPDKIGVSLLQSSSPALKVSVGKVSAMLVSLVS